MNRRTSLLFASAAVFVLAGTGCRREERGFQVNPPDASRIDSKQVSLLEPGPRNPSQPVPNAYEENAYAVSEGKRLYSQMNCVGCHAHGGGGMGPPLMDSLWIYGSNPEQIFATIVEGRPNGMPSFRGHLPDYAVWQLVAYVRSMSGLLSANVASGRSDDMQGRPPENTIDRQQPIQSGGIPKSAELP